MGTVTVVLTGDEQRMLRSLDRVIKKERDLARAAEDTGDVSTKASKKAIAGLAKQGKQAKTAGEELGSLAKRYIGVAAGVAALRAVVQSLTAAFTANADAADKARSSAARVAALGAGTKAERDAVLAQAGVLDPNAAFGLSFDAKSAGLSAGQTKDLFTEIQNAARLGEDPSQLGAALVPLVASTGRHVRQLSTFTRRAAKSSPLDQATFATQFSGVSGAAGPSAAEQASAAALLSPFVTVAGGESKADTARVALKGFLVKSLSAKAQALFARLGVEGESAVGQAQGLKRGLASGELTKGGLFDVFGERTGPLLAGVLQGTGLAGAERDEADLLGILDRPGGLPSSLQQKAQAQAARDPQAAAVFRQFQTAQRRKAGGVSRGFGQASFGDKLGALGEALEKTGGGSKALGVLRLATGQGSLEQPDLGAAGGAQAVGLGLPLSFFRRAAGGPRSSAAMTRRDLDEAGVDGRAGGQTGQTVAEILDDAGGLLDAQGGQRALMSTPHAQQGGTATIMRDLRDKLSELGQKRGADLGSGDDE